MEELIGEFGQSASGPSTGPFETLIGYRARTSPEHGVYLELDVEDKHLSHYGVAHGGVALALLDTVGGICLFGCRPGILRVATISLSTNFIAAVRPGRVIATAEIERIGGAVAYTTMRLHAHDFEGELLATGHGAYRLFQAEPA